MPDNKYLTSTPPITAAYVWTCATDFRASNAIADTASITCDPTEFSLTCRSGDLASLIAVSDMLDDPQYRSHSFDPDFCIVAVHGTYLGVYATAQSRFPAGQVDAVLAALAADRVEVAS